MYPDFPSFYSFYLTQHSNLVNRRLHFLGSSLALISVAAALVTLNPLWLLGAPIFGYGLAWFGHFVFEKNRPAAFKQPLYSFRGDWLMYWQIVTGKLLLW